MDVKDKVCVVTGSTGGIGLCIATRLQSEGAIVVTSGRRAEGVGELHVAADLAQPGEPERLIAAAVERFGRIDGLVNNAGITQPVRTLEISARDFDAIVDVNLRGTLYMSQAVIPAMQEQHGGSIVCMSSVSAQRGGGIFGGPHYSAAKAGVLGLAKAMAREFGPNRIRINSITPGLIQTDITGDKLTPAMREDIIKGIPLGRLGDAADVANACLFLLSDLSSYLTGVTLDVNGGMLIH